MEEVEEEAPKVCPGQVPDKRDAALKGQLDALCLTFLPLTLLVWVLSSSHRLLESCWL